SNDALAITSNDPTAPTKQIQLSGYWQRQSESENEPGLQTIINMMAGYGTNIANQFQNNYQEGATTPTYYGEEVVSPFWNAADATLPVSITHLVSFHSQVDVNNNNTPTRAAFGWYAKSSSPAATNWLFRDALY